MKTASIQYLSLLGMFALFANCSGETYEKSESYTVTNPTMCPPDCEEIDTHSELVKATKTDHGYTIKEADGTTANITPKSGFGGGGFSAGKGFNGFSSADVTTEDKTENGSYATIENSDSITVFYVKAGVGSDEILTEDGFVKTDPYVTRGAEAYAFWDSGNLSETYLAPTLDPAKGPISLEMVNFMAQYYDVNKHMFSTYMTTSNSGKIVFEPDGTFSGGANDIAIKGVLDGQNMTGTAEFNDMSGELEGFYGETKTDYATIGAFAGQNDTGGAFAGGWHANHPIGYTYEDYEKENAPEPFEFNVTPDIIDYSDLIKIPDS